MPIDLTILDRLPGGRLDFSSRTGGLSIGRTTGKHNGGVGLIRCVFPGAFAIVFPHTGRSDIKATTVAPLSSVVRASEAQAAPIHGSPVDIHRAAPFALRGKMSDIIAALRFTKPPT